MTPKQMGGLRRDVEESIRHWEADSARRFNPARAEDFSRLLQRLRGNGWDFGPDLAVRAGLALTAFVGGHRWPPPPALIDALLKEYIRPDHMDPRGEEHHLARALEFVVAFLVGWLRCPGGSACWGAAHAGRFPLDMSSRSWLGATAGAHEILRRFVGDRVASCLEHLAQGNRQGGVPGFPTHDHRPWTLDVMQTFLAHGRRCDCWRNIAPNAVRDALKGNARTKADSCARNHNIDCWQPARLTPRTGRVETLWYFVERAVKGFVGPFLHEGFPAGMLHSSLWRRDHRLHRVKVVQRQCPLCGWTVLMSCRCGGYRPAEETLRSKHWLIRMTADGEPDGGFVRGHFLECLAGHLYPQVLGICQFQGCEQTAAADAQPQTCYFMA